MLILNHFLYFTQHAYKSNVRRRPKQHIVSFSPVFLYFSEIEQLPCGFPFFSGWNCDAEAMLLKRKTTRYRSEQNEFNWKLKKNEYH